MGKIKVLVTSRIPNREVNFIKEKLGDDFEFIIPVGYSKDEILKSFDEDVEIILGNYVSKEMLDVGNIKYIQNPFAGVENFDFDLLRGYDIKLCNSHSNAEAVAEHALALIFSVLRSIPYHDRALREGHWNRDGKDISLFSNSLKYKTIGILGYGEIGRNLGQLLKPFGCKLLAMVRDKDKDYPELDFIGDEKDLDYILSNSDIVVSALPLTDKTRGLLDYSKLSKMNKNSYIINISRGNILDEEGLYFILKENKIAGAAIDTWYNYPKDLKERVYPSDKYAFHELNNLVLSPHRAAMIKGENTNVLDVVENFNRYIKGESLLNEVNIEEGY